MINIILLNDNNIKDIPSIQQFQTWINTALAYIPEKVPKHCDELCISIIDEITSAQLNEAYRGKKGATNVLSFTYETTPGIAQESLGDLAICAAIVEREATTQQQKIESHWAHLTIHGVLHLLGYDHIVDTDAQIMEALEIEILSKLHIENPYE